MTEKKQRRVRIADGICRRHGKLVATVTVGSGATRLQSEERFDLKESLRVIRAWQDSERDRLRKLRPHAGRTGLDGDIPRYLKTLNDRPRLKAERARQLEWWAEQ